MNRRLLIPIGAGALVVLLWFVALWGPQSSAFSKAKKRKSDAQAQGATLSDQLKRLQDARHNARQRRIIHAHQLHVCSGRIRQRPQDVEHRTDA